MAFQRKSSKHIADAQALLDGYNTRLAKADAVGNEFKAAEKPLRALGPPGCWPGWV
ncbi:hypothetical protein LDFHOB_07025 [Candidatus Electronema aureum]